MTTTAQKRLLITTSTYPRWPHDTTPDFVERFAQEQTKYFDEVHVLAPHFKGAKTYEKNHNIIVHRYRYFFPASAESIAYEGGGVDKIKKTPLYAIKLLCLLVSQLVVCSYIALRYKITTINPHWIIPQGWIAVVVGRLLKKPIVLTVHGSDIFALKGSLMRRVKRFVLRQSTAVCVNSRATAKACRELVDRTYQVIPMGIDIEKYAKTAPIKQKESDNQGFTILYVGRLSKVKGVQYLLEAAVHLKRERQDFRVLIGGSGPEQPKLEAFSREYHLEPEVQFLGWINHDTIPSYYQQADVFVGPSLFEAQGLVFAEALASGLPVIASRVGGIIDIVHDGINGFLITPQSSDELYQKLKQLMDSPELQKKFRSQATASVSQRYSWSAVGRKYRAVFQSASR